MEWFFARSSTNKVFGRLLWMLLASAMAGNSDAHQLWRHSIVPRPLSCALLVELNWRRREARWRKALESKTLRISTTTQTLLTKQAIGCCFNINSTLLYWLVIDRSSCEWEIFHFEQHFWSDLSLKNLLVNTGRVWSWIAWLGCKFNGAFPLQIHPIIMLLKHPTAIIEFNAALDW